MAVILLWFGFARTTRSCLEHLHRSYGLRRFQGQRLVRERRPMANVFLNGFISCSVSLFVFGKSGVKPGREAFLDNFTMYVFFVLLRALQKV